MVKCQTYLYFIYCKHTLTSVLTCSSDFVPSKQCTVYSNAEFLMKKCFSDLGCDSLKLVVPHPYIGHKIMALKPYFYILDSSETISRWFFVFA